MTVSTFVLIPGAWHSASCWQRVVPLLQEQGHHVITPELLGMGNDNTPLSQVDLTSWVNQTVDIIRKQQQLVILVGHSRGGILISQVAEFVPEKIKLLVYVTAYLIPSGEALYQSATKTDFGEVVIKNSDGTTTLKPDKSIAIFYNMAPEEWMTRVPSLLSTEPAKSFVTPLKLSDENYGTVPRAYIECKQDKAVSLATQRSMQSRLPCKYVITMDTDHSPFISAPSELVTHLIDLAEKI
ncbi:hypothetical protein I4U23_017292 [Adineta vaga]|nr:hypothetical protein I4U23_017292 [Adineta vaga]